MAVKPVTPASSAVSITRSSVALGRSGDSFTSSGIGLCLGGFGHLLQVAGNLQRRIGGSLIAGGERLLGLFFAPRNVGEQPFVAGDLGGDILLMLREKGGAGKFGQRLFTGDAGGR